jgi:molybdopterin-guanine dinucleotide biosynthesis protein A
MGRDKATLKFCGPNGDTTFVERAVTILGDRCSPCRGGRTWQPLPSGLDADVLRDEVRGVGPCWPRRGLRGGQAGRDLAFVCAVDMPYLTVDLIDELVGPAVRLHADVVLPWDGRDHYLAGVYRTALAARADELVAAGERSMRALIDVTDTQRVVMSEQRALINVNTADLV